MMRSVVDLRAALNRLAAQAPTSAELDHRPWTAGARPLGHSPRRRRSGNLVAVAASVVVLLAAVAVVAVLVLRDGDAPTPATGGRAALEARPLIAPAIRISSTGPKVADPLRGLPFAVPSSEADYARLSGAQRGQLLAALARTDCAAQAASDAAVRVACTGAAGAPLVAVLLGPTVFGTRDVARAVAVAPSIDGVTEWTVNLELNSRGAAAWLHYTSAHYETDPGVADPSRCASNRVPCRDFVAFVVDGRAISVPITLAPLDRFTQISGNFTERTAKRLAQELGR